MGTGTTLSNAVLAGWTMVVHWRQSRACGYGSACDNPGMLSQYDRNGGPVHAQDHQLEGLKIVHALIQSAGTDTRILCLCRRM